MVRIKWYFLKDRLTSDLGEVVQAAPPSWSPPSTRLTECHRGDTPATQSPCQAEFLGPRHGLAFKHPRVGLAWQSSGKSQGSPSPQRPSPLLPETRPARCRKCGMLGTLEEAAAVWSDHIPESSNSESPDTRERSGTGRRPQGAAESRGVAAERGPPDAGAADGRGPAHVAAFPVEFAVREGWLRAQAGGQRDHGREKPRLCSGPRPRGGSGGWWSETPGALWPRGCSRRSRRSDRPVSPPPPAFCEEHHDSQGPPRLARPTPYPGRTGCSAARRHPAPPPPLPAVGPPCLLPGSAWRTGRAICRPDSRGPELRPERCWAPAARGDLRARARAPAPAPDPPPGSSAAGEAPRPATGAGAPSGGAAPGAARPFVGSE